MIQMKSATSPTLDANGSFAIPMGEFATIRRDVVNKPVTGAAASGTNIITMSDTAGFFPGQLITIQDTLASEQRLVLAVTAGVQITVTVNLTNTYLTARGAQVTVQDLSRSITGTATLGGTAIPLTDTTNFIAGQTIIIEDALHAETVLINAIVANTQITATGNLVHTYTVANGARVSVVNGNPARAAVQMQKSFAAVATGAELLDVTWWAGINWIVITGNFADAAGGPALPYTWAVLTTAKAAGLQFTAIIDGE